MGESHRSKTFRFGIGGSTRRNEAAGVGAEAMRARRAPTVAPAAAASTSAPPTGAGPNRSSRSDAASLRTRPATSGSSANCSSTVTARLAASAPASTTLANCAARWSSRMCWQAASLEIASAVVGFKSRIAAASGTVSPAIRSSPSLPATSTLPFTPPISTPTGSQLSANCSLAPPI